ncbi:inorganic diphosphatase, partial [Acinetobacter gerneri]
RPVGVMYMEDEAGIDAKIIAVPHSKLTPLYDNVKDLNDLPQLQLDQMKHFFEHYKDLEKGKWMKFNGWGNIEEARMEIIKAIKNHK